MGQPLRRRHDRADRLLVGLPRDARLRHAAHARHAISLPPVLSRRMPGSLRSTSGRRRIGRRVPVELGLVGDVKATIAALLPRLTRKHRQVASRRVPRRTTRRPRERPGRAGGAAGPAGSRIHPQYLARVVSELADEDAIFTCDVGTPTVWAARYLTMNGKRRLIGSFNHGSMANAMPQAIGAQAAFPERQVISLSGDGGFTMLMGDLLTPQAARAAGQGHRVQQRLARLRRAWR